MSHLALAQGTLVDSCVGIDTGPATGFFFADYLAGELVARHLFQCDAASAEFVLTGHLRAYYPGKVIVPVIGRRVGSVERFVGGAAAASRGKNADVTRQLAFTLVEVLQGWGYTVKLRNAGEVKPWAGDKRLQAAGYVTGAMHGDLNHGYDAGRHCLFGAVEAGITKDPLIGKRTA